MKKVILLFSFFCLLFAAKSFSQTVYVNQSGSLYHTNKCKLYTKNFEAVPLWKAKGPYAKKPCPKCHPPTVESKTVVKKTNVKPKPKTATAPATKKK
jgi:hypothetical protein